MIRWARGLGSVRRLSSAVGEAGCWDSAEEDSLYSRVEVKTSGSEAAVLRSYETFFLSAAAQLGVDVVRSWQPAQVHSRKTVLKSAYVHKKHRVQYETVSYFRCSELRHLTGSTLSVFLEYVQRNLPEGVAMVVTKEKRERLPPHIQHEIPSNPEPSLSS